MYCSGALILQQTHNLSDGGTVPQIAFNIQWHYALDITEESDEAMYICPKTLWNMRKIVTDNEPDTVSFHQITDCDKEEKKIKPKTLNLIIHLEVEPACISDAHTLAPALESTKDRGCDPQEVLADFLYSSYENCESAKTIGAKVASLFMS